MHVGNRSRGRKGSRLILLKYFTSKCAFLPSKNPVFLTGCQGGSLRSSSFASSGQEDLDLTPPTPPLTWGSPYGHRNRRGKGDQDLNWAPIPTVDLRCPICASGTRSRIMRQASYTMVEGSNCIVFTTLPMLIFSERATMVAAGLSPLLRHLSEERDGLALTAGPSEAQRPSSSFSPTAASLLPKSQHPASTGEQELCPQWQAQEGVPLSILMLTLGSLACAGTLVLRSQSLFDSSWYPVEMLLEGGSVHAGAREISQHSMTEWVIIKPAVTQKPQEENPALTQCWQGPSLAIRDPRVTSRRC